MSWLGEKKSMSALTTSPGSLQPWCWRVQTDPAEAGLTSRSGLKTGDWARLACLPQLERFQCEGSDTDTSVLAGLQWEIWRWQSCSAMAGNYETRWQDREQQSPMFSGCSQGQKVVKVEVSEKVQSLFEIISGSGWAERSSGRETVCVPDLITHDQTNHHCPLQIFSSQDPDNN